MAQQLVHETADRVHFVPDLLSLLGIVHLNDWHQIFRALVLLFCRRLSQPNGKVLEGIVSSIDLSSFGQGLRRQLHQVRCSAEGLEAVAGNEVGSWEGHVEQVGGGRWQGRHGCATWCLYYTLLQI